ncbi:MAG: hypothetical protein D6713_01190 [Deltaproteobacteria bacterium]|nr:MAG: hypothetical protein D6713_01190 [Deltaproteobacteria bacterium]
MKKIKEHSSDTGIPGKFVRRSLDFLEEVGLIRVVRGDGIFGVSFEIPVDVPPPEEVDLPLWVSNLEERKPIPPEVRRSVYEMDGEMCFYCGKKLTLKEAVIDHVFPYQKGGADTIENMVCACKSCNKEKWHRTPGDKRFIYPRTFRRRKVRSVSFERTDAGFVPVVEYE